MPKATPKAVFKPDPSVSQTTADRLLEKATAQGGVAMVKSVQERVEDPKHTQDIGHTVPSVNPVENALKTSEQEHVVEEGSIKQMAYEGAKTVAIGAVTVANPAAGRALYVADKVGLVDKALGVKEQQQALPSQQANDSRAVRNGIRPDQQDDDAPRLS